MIGYALSLNRILLIGYALIWLSSCDQLGLQKPSAASGKRQPAFDHAGIVNGCNECHEVDRPAPVEGVIHGENKDCSECHSFNRDKGWASLSSFNHIPTPNSCLECHESARPTTETHIKKVDCKLCHEYNDWKKITFSHTPEPETCLTCHEVDRPKVPHVAAGDCKLCHTNPDWSKTHTYNHDPLPKTCIECHAAKRPAKPHDAEGECSGCHKFPNWSQAVSFNHYQPKPTSCGTCHNSKRPAAPHPTDGDCVGCHNFPDWKNAIFSHTPKPATCGDYCHVRPTATAQRAYPNQGPPAGFTEGGPGSGHFNGKECVECHLTPPEGGTTFGFDHSKPSLKFCLPCHYDKGVEEHGANTSGYEMTGYGNCNTCHKDYDRNVRRRWEP